ncbi:hypothetical protein [Halobacillus mangrovi]
MEEIIQRTLRKIQDDSSIKEVRQVSGGDINRSYYVETKNHQYFYERK